ncbi:MAG TPA: polyprenyl synthetase family protein [Clostridia bacterium]
MKTLEYYAAKVSESDKVLEEFLNKLGFPEIREACKRTVQTPSKKIRPALLLLVADEVGNALEDSYYPAAAITLLHNATITFDDVITKNSVRRNLPSAYSLYGSSGGTMLGVSLHALAHQIVWEGNLPLEMKAYLSNAFARFCSYAAMGVGSYLVRQKNLQEYFERARQESDPSIVINALDEEAYMENLKSRTGAIFGVAAEMGAITGGVDPEKARNFNAFGLFLGTAFQVLDDIIDFIPESSQRAGKMSGRELIEGRVSSIVIHSLKKSKSPDLITHVLGNSEASNEELEKAVKEICDTGGLEYGMVVASQLIDEAVKMLSKANHNEQSLLYGLNLDLVINQYKIPDGIMKSIKKGVTL